MFVLFVRSTPKMMAFVCTEVNGGLMREPETYMPLRHVPTAGTLPGMAHELTNWRKRSGLRVEDVLKRLRINSRTTLYRYERGERVPEPPVMRRIMEQTQGEVRPEHFYGANSDSQELPEGSAG